MGRIINICVGDTMDDNINCEQKSQWWKLKFHTSVPGWCQHGIKEPTTWIAVAWAAFFWLYRHEINTMIHNALVSDRAIDVFLGLVPTAFFALLKSKRQDD